MIAVFVFTNLRFFPAIVFFKAQARRQGNLCTLRLPVLNSFLPVFCSLMIGASFHHCKMKNSCVTLCKVTARHPTHSGRCARILRFSKGAQ